MGGIKNREEKKKAAKVFSCGSGGGTKGPSVIDKRNIEEKCPFCDRIFKQNSRLKDHVARQHPNGAAAGAGGGEQQLQDQEEAGVAPNAAQQPSAAGSAGASSSSTGGTTAAAALPPRSAAAGAPAGAGGTAAGTAAGGGMFDVGSRAGFYTEKAPRLMLAEWCAAQKRPRPKFKAVPVQQQAAAGGAGGFRARVVLPDAKRPGTDRDVVVWLDPQDAAPDEEEALQRAAVAALSVLAGERSLDYVLPARYRSLWRELGKRAATRADEQRRAAAAAAKAAAATTRASRAAAAARSAPAVVMSDAQRAAVEGLVGVGSAACSTQPLGTLAANGSNDSKGSRCAEAPTSAAASSTQDTAEACRLVDALVRTGFAAADARAAVAAVGVVAAAGAAAAAAAANAAAVVAGRSGARLQRCGEGLQPYLDWLCLSLPVQRLPARYRPGGSSGTVGVLRTVANGMTRSEVTTTPTTTAAASVDDELAWRADPTASLLVACGYPPGPVCAALAAAAGDQVAALLTLTRQLTAGCTLDAAALMPKLVYAGDSSQGGSKTVGADGGDASGSVPLSEPWVEECQVLESIYGEQLVVEPGGGLRLGLQAETPDGQQCSLQLLAWCPVAPLPYPDAPPLLALQSEQLTPAQLLRLTRRIAADAAGPLLGQQMLYELASRISDALAEGCSSADETLPAPFDALPPGSAATTGRDSAGNGDGARDALAQEEGDCVEYDSQAEAHAAAAEAALGAKSKSQVATGERAPRPRRRPVRPPPSAAEQEAESQRLCQLLASLAVAPRHAGMRAARAALPAAAMRPQVLEAVANNDVLVISGATGCGKSTQVPQFLLEDAVQRGQGGATSIIVCQPRRIAAVGLATRVAAETGDPAGLGGLVGYSVRLDSRCSSSTRLLFCTTGVLLRRLADDPDLQGVTHVVLDEVHERSLDVDLLLLLLRRTLLVPPREQHRPVPPKLVLMSATADAKGFVSYFDRPGPCADLGMLAGQSHARAARRLDVAMLNIPGFTHPVRQFWLEDALQATGLVVGRGSRYAKRARPKAEGRRTVPRAIDNGDNDGAADREASGSSSDDDDDEDENSGGSLLKQAPTAGTYDGGLDALDAPQGNYSDATLRSLACVDPSLLHYELIEALLAHVLASQAAHGPAALLQGWRRVPPSALAAAARRTGPGAVLVFMPGAPEIERLVRQLRGSAPLAAAAQGRPLVILPLHGGLPASAQAAVFETPPAGGIKVVVATNVAETSITIDDVTVVIDTGRHKEASYDASRGLSRLDEAWVSQAAAQQRRGRAGRVAPGVCFRLWPAAMWCRLEPQQAPEVLRAPLQTLSLTTQSVLDTLTIRQGSTAPPLPVVLGCLLTPPRQADVDAALDRLTSLGALAVGGQGGLTPLGRHLAAMPLDAPLGKALIMGALLRCADPLLTVAAALGHGRPLWLSAPPDRRAEADAARRALAPQAYAQRSDHLAIVAAFNGWAAARASGGRSAGSDFARANWLSEQTLDGIAKGRTDYAATLAARGFLPPWYPQYAAQAGSCGRGAGSISTERSAIAAAEGGPDEYSSNARIIKAALCAGFYPRILRVEAPVRYVQMSGGAVRGEANPGSIKLFDRALGRVWLHPSSVCFHAGSYTSGWLMYSQLVCTSKPWVREASMVPLYALLAFGGELEVLHDAGLLLLDGWARFRAPARVGLLIRELRSAVASLLDAKVADPELDLVSAPAVAALHALLATDGF